MFPKLCEQADPGSLLKAEACVLTGLERSIGMNSFNRQ